MFSWTLPRWFAEQRRAGDLARPLEQRFHGREPLLDREGRILRQRALRAGADLPLEDVRVPLGGFLAAHPHVRLDVVISDGPVDIVVAGFDARIQLGEVIDGDMIAVPVTVDSG